MRSRLGKLRDDETGMSFAFIAVGFLAFFSASTIAVDVGLMMAARAQAQTAADAAALAGAVALVQDSFTNRTPSGPAVQSAVNTALGNTVVGAAPSVWTSDVTFPNDPAGQPTRVRVKVFRTDARANAIPTLTGKVFGINKFDVGATATAEASPANAMTCVKPFTIPDRWIENQTGAWDIDDSFDLYDNKGKKLKDPDVYIGPEDPVNYTGYNPDRDKGMVVRLKADNNTKLTASFYNPWDMPAGAGNNGASDYRWNIGNCNTSVLGYDFNMPVKNGNMVGPTQQGVNDLIALDPGAEWDTQCNCVTGSTFGIHSPRISIIPVFDPVAYAEGKEHGNNITLKLKNYIGIFIEDMQGNEVYGRVMPVNGIMDGGLGPAPAGAFPKVVRLVE